MSASLPFTPNNLQYIREHALSRTLGIIDAVIDDLQTPNGAVGDQIKLRRPDRIVFTNDLLARGVFQRLIPLNTTFANQLARQYERDVEAEGLT